MTPSAAAAPRGRRPTFPALAASTALAALAALAVVGGCAHAGSAGAVRPDPYGVPAAGAPAALFAPGVMSTGDAFSAAFTPDGRTLVFTRRGPGRADAFLWTARFDGARWSAPERAAVPAADASGRAYSSADPFITRDGRLLYFSWERPRPGMPADSAADYDTWVAERAGDGWGAPRHLGDAPHSTAADMYPAVTRDGTLYFDSFRPGLPARRNLWRARAAGGAYGPAEPLPPTINGAGGATNPYVDPDERYLIFSADRPGGYGRGDLYVAWRTADGWSAPRNLGPRVNGPGVEFCPTVSPDGRALLFSRITFVGDRAARDDIYVVAIDVLPPPA